MAEQLADQMVEGYRRYPIDDHGKFRIQYYSISALAVAFAQNDTVKLFDLPPGRIRILPCLSRVTNSAFGAARTWSIGHKAYTKSPPATQEALNATAWINAMDVSGAVNAAAWSTVLKYDVYSVAGITVFATIGGGTMPIGASASGFMAYVYE